RIPKSDSRSKRVKKRQRRENGVVFRRVEQLLELRDVSDNVAVTDYYTFWFAGASACKKQDRFPVTALLWNLQKPQKQTGGNENRNHPPKNDLAFHSRHQFVQLENAFRPRKILEAFNELRGRNSDPQIGAFAARFIRRPSDREIKIDGHFVRQGHGQVRYHRSFACRQDDGDPFVGKFFSKVTAQCCGGPEQFRAAQGAVIESINDGGRGSPSLQSTDARFGKMSI